MPSCFICGRSRNAKTKSENITFHRFPSKSFILQKWHAFIIGNNLKLENIKKNSLICSCHFIPESFIVYNKHRMLQTHAVPTIVIKRVKHAKITFPELKQETIQPTSSISSTSQLQTKKILVK
ncbi:THAP domain-containing protein 1-like, partial [Aphis craccivora]